VIHGSDLRATPALGRHAIVGVLFRGSNRVFIEGRRRDGRRLMKDDGAREGAVIVILD
jgi:hypothetical protein